MKKIILFLFLTIPIFGLTTQVGKDIGDRQIQGGHLTMWVDSILHNVGFDLNSTISTVSPQIGGYMATNFRGSRWEADQIFVRSKISGSHIPYYNGVTINSPTIDSGAGADYIKMMEIMDCFGADSTCRALETHKGPVIIGDTLIASRLLWHGGGVNWHGSLDTISRNLSDTDYILIVFPVNHSIHDTLPLLANAPGRGYIFIQYTQSVDSNFVLIPHSGEKIDSYDSVVMRSNAGISDLQIVSVGNRWHILRRHEEGGWIASLTGITGASVGTGYYRMDNMSDFSITVPQLFGAGTLLALSGFTITGMPAQALNSTLDTGQVCVQGALGFDNGARTDMICHMAFADGIIKCERYDLGLLSALGGTRGLQYKLTFGCAMPSGAQAKY